MNVLFDIKMAFAKLCILEDRFSIHIVLKKLAFLGYNQHNFGLTKHKNQVFRVSAFVF